MSDPTAPPEVSPDGRFYWDGNAWQPLPGKAHADRRPLVIAVVAVVAVVVAAAVVVAVVVSSKKDKAAPTGAAGSTQTPTTAVAGLAHGAEAVLLPRGNASPATLKATGDVLRSRLEGLGIGSFRVAVEGSSVVVDIGDNERRRDVALGIVGARGQLLFRPVIQQLPASEAARAPATGPPTTRPPIDLSGTTKPENDDPARQVILPEHDDGGRVIARYLLGPAEITGAALASAKALEEPTTGTWEVEFTLTSSGSKLWNDMAAKVGRGNRIAIDVDGVVTSAPSLDTTDFPGKGRITGNFSEDDARGLAAALASGVLPVAVDRQAIQTLQRVTTPSGKDPGRSAAGRSFTLSAFVADPFETVGKAIGERLEAAGFLHVQVDKVGADRVRVAVFGANPRDDDVLRVLLRADSGLGAVRREDIAVADLLVI